ncbi:MAG: hypothetical protein ACXIUW_02845 [Roseinatronobacter sp.]
MVRGKTNRTDATPTATLVTTARPQGLNEWGVPDWRQASVYGDVNQWTLNRWRWEFFRRRDDLRAFFDRWADDSCNRNLGCNAGKLPNDRGFRAFGGDEEGGSAIRLFDYGGVPNPRIGDQPAISIMPADQFFHRFRFYNPLKREPLGLSVREALGEKLPRIYELSLQDHEYAIKFDLNKPLRSQVDEALQILKEAQIALHGKPVQRRHHTEKWLGYLRTLDARAANATWAEITALHPGTAQTEQTARDIWDAANGLRFNF